MSDMEHAIEQAARIADDILCTDPQVAREMFGDEPDRIARALAEAGLLAPSPLREEWRALSPPGCRVQPDERTMSGNAFWFLDDEWTLILDGDEILFGDDSKKITMTRDEAELLARCLDSAVAEHDSNAADQKL